MFVSSIVSVFQTILSRSVPRLAATLAVLQKDIRARGSECEAIFAPDLASVVACRCDLCIQRGQKINKLGIYSFISDCHFVPRTLCVTFPFHQPVQYLWS
jgi:hypothetical protein